jgi:hypothetical protein
VRRSGRSRGGVGCQNSVRDERNRGFTGGRQVSAPRTGSRAQVVGTVNLSVFGVIRLGREHSVPPANRDDHGV